jgi:hypothetical protein
MRDPFFFGDYDPGVFPPAARWIGLIVSTVLIGLLVTQTFFVSV